MNNRKNILILDILRYMKLLSWNINGWRACIQHGLYDFLEEKNPDIMGFQELKYDKKPTLPEELESYHLFWNPAEKKGYSGTAILCKNKPLKNKNGLGIKKFDKEGRLQTLEFENFFFVNAYFPNSQRELIRLDFKLEFNDAILKHIKKLEQSKPVILCGDFNVAHQEIDIKNPKSNEKNAGFTKEERNWMTSLLNENFIDIFRTLHPQEEKYTWWTYRFNARKRNIGWRIDYFVISQEFKQKVKDAFIMGNVFGSDHAPIGMEVEGLK